MLRLHYSLIYFVPTKKRAAVAKSPKVETSVARTYEHVCINIDTGELAVKEIKG